VFGAASDPAGLPLRVGSEPHAASAAREERRRGPKSGFPKFKRKGERDSARLYEIELSERHIRLPKIGQVRIKEMRSKRGFEGRTLSATITRRADRWFCSLAVEREREIVLPKPASGRTTSTSSHRHWRKPSR